MYRIPYLLYTYITAGKRQPAASLPIRVAFAEMRVLSPDAPSFFRRAVSRLYPCRAQPDCSASPAQCCTFRSSKSLAFGGWTRGTVSIDAAVIPSMMMAMSLCKSRHASMELPARC